MRQRRSGFALTRAEKKHIETFDKVVTQHRVRPTLFYPLWKLAAWSLGAGTGLMGREAAMACTEAVETVIGEHYDECVRRTITGAEARSQIRALAAVDSSHPSIPLLRNSAPTRSPFALSIAVLTEFRDDELEHLDTAVENDAQKAPNHALLSAIIAAGCRGAIYASERL